MKPSCRCGVFLALIVGLGAYTGFAVESELRGRLPPCVAKTSFSGVARVVGSEPAVAGQMFARTVVETSLSVADCASANARLRLSWPVHLGQPQVGERWWLTGKVSAPWGMVNPGGFDYERWLLGRGLDGTGYVSRGWRVRSAPGDVVVAQRAAIREVIQASGDATGLVRAVVLGDGHAISVQLWDQLRASGTVHLAVVSGLHVSIAAGGAVLVVWWGLRWLPGAALRLPLRALAGISGVLAALVYLLLSQGGVPLLRACISAALATIAVLARRRFGAWRVLGAVFLGVMLVHPLAVLTSGLWLSFAAVGLLILLFSMRSAAPQPFSWLRYWARAQLGLTIGLMPWVAAWTGAVAPLGIVANLLAVPWVSLVLVPFSLLGLFGELVGVGGSWSFRAATLAADGFLAWLGALDWPLLLAPSQPLWVILLSAIGSLALLLPLPLRARLCLLPLALAWAAPAAPRMPAGEVSITALDVGQGSAALIETRRQVMVFDTGARYASGFDIGERVVLPAIAADGGRSVHRIVVSHSDLDHAGGLASVREHHRSARVLRPRPTSAFETSCHTESSWQMDGVRFTFLTSARIQSAASSNDRSCTLLIETDRARALLTGDTSGPLEVSLARQLDGRVDLLLAPHHGSDTSSSRTFVRRASPRWVFVSAGKANRYGHPHPRVLERYASVGAEVRTTFEYGALTWRSDRPGLVRALRREAGAAFWRQGVPSEST